ncbi:MAG TPA: molybdopterin cofactor-binding domain-containing protein, partial [Usitatibacter sp.]|nr:molybdopterin cofactor-binding domain-containing protein [Usitatibacter sp.]
MTITLDRREFLKASIAAGGALALEFSLPASAGVLDMSRPGEKPEITHWIVVHPDDRVVIRIARSEMGQGSMTGLAQLVAEELQCDWHKVSTEFVSPNEHIKRHRVWGSMSTGGSAAIRTSQDYLRKSGAAAREMLV